MNVIFLDVDGVLNSINKLIEVYEKTHKPHHGYDYPFDEKCLENLSYIVSQTDANLVVSSTWRKDLKGIHVLLNKLKEYHLESRVIGRTPDLWFLPEREYKALSGDKRSGFEKKQEISSEGLQNLLTYLKPYNLNLGDITGLPADLHHCGRGLEIKAFIKSFPNKSFLKAEEDKYLFKPFRDSINASTKVDNFVILDDDHVGALANHHVLCRTQVGLTKENALEAVNILNSKIYHSQEEERER